MDYINSNFISLRDLEDIDSHINTLSERKLALTKAIHEKADVNQQTASIDSEAAPLLNSFRELASLTSIEAVELLQKKYGDIDALSSLRQMAQKKQELEKENAILLQAMEVESQLDSLKDSTSIQELTQAAESIDRVPDQLLRSELHLHLDTVLDPLRTSIAKQLKAELDEIKWLSPQEKVKIPAEKFKLITSKFAELIDIQAINKIPEYPQSWFGLDVLLSPFFVRFQYHFNQASETNKISRPEWVLNYLETFLSDHFAVLELVIGSSFSKHGRIAIYEVITALLNPLREKLSQMIRLINASIEKALNEGTSTSLDRDGRLLSHLIFETASFDQRLRKNYKYNPFIEVLNQAPTKKWTGLTGDVLISSNGENSAVNNWLNLEFRLANSRFDNDIVGAPNAFDIDYEFNASSDDPNVVLKPSYSAYALVKLFDNLTTHFKSLSVAKYQLKYFSKIQLVLLDDYFNSLEKKFSQFNDSLGLKLIANFLPGSVKNETNDTTQEITTNGLKGLEILTGLYCLIKFVIEKMEEWSTDLVYIQLWNVYNAISSAKESEGSIFGATIVQYNSLLEKVLGKYGEFFQREIRGVLKEYVNSCAWIVQEDTSKNQPSTQLTNFIMIMPSYMSFLRRSLPEIDYFLVSSKACDAYASIIQEYVISNNQFNKNGLGQLKIDLKCLDDYLDEYLLLDTSFKYSNAGNRNYKKLVQSMQMMEHFDATTAKLLKKNMESNADIRAEFSDGLDFLTDNNLRDLLFRIV